MSIDMTLPKWAIFTTGVYGEISYFFVGSNWNFISEYIKHVDTWHTPWKFQLEKKSNKKSIAKKRLTNLHEMSSKRLIRYLIKHFCPILELNRHAKSRKLLAHFLKQISIQLCKYRYTLHTVIWCANGFLKHPIYIRYILGQTYNAN